VIGPSLKFSRPGISRSLAVTHGATQPLCRKRKPAMTPCLPLALVSYAYFSFLVLTGTTGSSSINKKLWIIYVKLNWRWPMQLLKEFAHRGALLRHTEKNLYLLLSQSATHPLQLLCSLLQILYLRLVYSGPLTAIL